MLEETAEETATETGVETSTETSTAAPSPDDVIAELRAELARRDEAAQAAELAAAEKQGEYERLWGEAKPKLESLQGELDAFREAVTARNGKRVKALPETMRDLIPEGMSGAALQSYLDRIEPLKAQFLSPAGTRTRTDVAGSEQSATILEFARRNNIPADEAGEIYRAYKARMGSK